MRALQTKLGDWGKQGPAVRASASEQRSALQAELRLRRILRLASGTLHAGPLQCAEISRGRPLQTLSSPCLHRQLVALGRRRHLERADDPAQEAVIVRDRRQLDQPLHAVTLGERVEGRLVDAVGAHQLLGVGHDLALLNGKLAGIGLLADQVDGLLTNTAATSCIDLSRPDVRTLPLPRSDQDGEGAELGLDDALVTVEAAQAEHSLGQLGTVQQHAEGPAHLPEDLQHTVDDGVVLSGYVGLSGYRCDSRHDRSPFRCLCRGCPSGPGTRSPPAARGPPARISPWGSRWEESRRSGRRTVNQERPRPPFRTGGAGLSASPRARGPGLPAACSARRDRWRPRIRASGPPSLPRGTRRSTRALRGSGWSDTPPPRAAGCIARD